MKIIYANRRPWPDKNPTASFVTFNAHALAEIGIETHLVIGKGTNKKPQKTLPEYYSVQNNFNLNIHLVPYLKISSLLFYLLATFKIWRLIKNKKTDAVISRDVGFLPYMAWLKKRTGVIVLSESHNFFMEITDGPDMQGAMKHRKKYLPIERKWLPKMDGLLCILSPQAELYKKHLPAKMVHVVLPGTLKAKNIFNIKKEEFWIGYIGSLQAQRDFETVFKAFAKIKNPKIKLLIIGGRGKEMPRLNKLIELYGVGKKVKITGWLSYSEVIKHMETLSVGIVPMRDNLYNSSLTAPMKILDYLSIGLPTVATDLPSAREFVGDDGAGLFYPAGDAEALSGIITKLASDPSLLTDMSKQALAQAEKISWTNRAKKIEQIVVDILNKKYSSFNKN